MPERDGTAFAQPVFGVPPPEIAVPPPKVVVPPPGDAVPSPMSSFNLTAYVKSWLAAGRHAATDMGKT